MVKQVLCEVHTVNQPEQLCSPEQPKFRRLAIYTIHLQSPVAGNTCFRSPPDCQPPESEGSFAAHLVVVVKKKQQKAQEIREENYPCL